MKTGIHPEYMPSRITCACGRVTETYGTVEEIHVEICSHCHPFFTGKQKLVDTAGRVERFRRKYRAGEGPSDVEGSEESAEAETASESEAIVEPEAKAEAEAAAKPEVVAEPEADAGEADAEEAAAESTEAGS